MKIENQSLNEIVVTFADSDDVLLGAHHVLTELSRDQNIWVVQLVLSPESYALKRFELQEMGFVPSGFLSSDARTWVKVKKQIRTSPDGGVSRVDNFGNRPDDSDTSALQEFVREHPEYKHIYERHKDEF